MLVVSVSGDAVATCWEPLLLATPSVVTTAVRLPTAVGCVVKPIVSVDAVAEVTVPAAPSLKVTLSLAVFVSKPKPAIVTVALTRKVGRAAGDRQCHRGHLHGPVAVGDPIGRHHCRQSCPAPSAVW